MGTHCCTCCSSVPKLGVRDALEAPSAVGISPHLPCPRPTAQSGVCTMVFLTDNYWVFDRLRRNATRMHVLSVRDLTPHETFEYLSGTHARHFPDEPPISKAQSLRIWDLIGGRLAYLSKAVKRRDVEGAARDLVAEETEWLHSHLGLIPDHDGQSMLSVFFYIEHCLTVT